MANFREKLAQSANSGNGSNSKDVVVINMQSKANYGSLVFVPHSPNTGGDPVEVVNDVMELAYVQEGKDKDGKAFKSKKWYRLLNREDLGTLTPDELEEYKDLRQMGKKFAAHKFSKSDKENRKMQQDRIRFKNYTLMTGWVIEHKDTHGKVVHKSCPALLVFSSNRFNEAFNDALKAKDKKSGGIEWQAKLFNDEFKKKQYISIDYKLSEDPKKIGYLASVSIEKFDEDTVRYTDGNETCLDLTKKEDLLKKIGSPISLFLGHSGKPYSSKIAEKMRKRFHVQLNKYCGANYPLEDGVEVEDKSAPVDPVAGVKKSDKADSIPTDEERAAESKHDAWD